MLVSRVKCSFLIPLGPAFVDNFYIFLLVYNEGIQLPHTTLHIMLPAGISNLIKFFAIIIACRFVPCVSARQLFLQYTWFGQ